VVAAPLPSDTDSQGVPFADTVDTAASRDNTGPSASYRSVDILDEAEGEDDEEVGHAEEEVGEVEVGEVQLTSMTMRRVDSSTLSRRALACCTTDSREHRCHLAVLVLETLTIELTQ
jgi:hypothetical protein